MDFSPAVMLLGQGLDNLFVSFLKEPQPSRLRDFILALNSPQFMGTFIAAGSAFFPLAFISRFKGVILVFSTSISLSHHATLCFFGSVAESSWAKCSSLEQKGGNVHIPRWAKSL